MQYAESVQFCLWSLSCRFLFLRALVAESFRANNGGPKTVKFASHIKFTDRKIGQLNIVFFFIVSAVKPIVWG